MHSSDSLVRPVGDEMPLRLGSRPAASRLSWLHGGEIDGNEQLTAMTGVILILLFGVLGITIVRIGQLIWLHLFLGFLLLGPVLLKVASTGYRFIRYYVRDAVYRAKGPPVLALRAMGPVVVLTTVAVFATGIWLMIVGPRDRSTPLLLHKASFIIWLGFMGIHVLAHLPGLTDALRAVRVRAERSGHRVQGARAGAVGRWIALGGALVGGVVLAIVLIPHFGSWTAPGALPHEH